MRGPIPKPRRCRSGTRFGARFRRAPSCSTIPSPPPHCPAVGLTRRRLLRVGQPPAAPPPRRLSRPRPRRRAATAVGPQPLRWVRPARRGPAANRIRTPRTVSFPWPVPSRRSRRGPRGRRASCSRSRAEGRGAGRCSTGALAWAWTQSVPHPLPPPPLPLAGSSLLAALGWRTSERSENAARAVQGQVPNPGYLPP